MKKNARLYTQHILREIAMVELFVGNDASRLEDSMTFYAVLRAMQTLSESAHRLPQEFKEQHPHISWKSINGVRNVLVHEYLNGYDKPDIWQIIEVHLPELKRIVENYDRELRS